MREAAAAIMVETMAMSCMQQHHHHASYFAPPPLAPPIGSCKGVGSPHNNNNSHHHHHNHHSQPHFNHHNQHIMGVNTASPAPDPELGDLGELVNSYYSESLAQFDSGRMFNGNQPIVSDISYDSTQCFENVIGSTDCTNVTALNKTLMVNTTFESFEGRHPNSWNQAHMVQWISRVCEQSHLDYEKLRLDLDLESLTGTTLLQMTEREFSTKFNHGGDILYEAFHRHLQDLKMMEESSGPFSYHQSLDTQNYWTNETIPSHNNNNFHLFNAVHNSNTNNQSSLLANGHYHDSQTRFGYLLPMSNSTMMLDHGTQVKSEIDSEGESNHSYTNLYPQENITIPSVDTKLQRRKPGRPPIKDKKSKAGGQRNSRLWEFIRDLLLDSKTCPSLLKWENVDEGIFRFVQSDKVARLWGERKCNPRMTYEKLSRAMRYYYKSQVFQPVIGRRLVYKFGPNATGWRPSPHLYS